MLSRRLLRVFNVLAAFVVVALGAAVWWFFWRPLPQTSGETAAPVSARVEISRDALGVPHIKAANQADVLFAEGYVVASERLWQMDALRRAASGELSEIVGPVALQVDQGTRRLRMRRMAEAIYATLSPHDRADAAAYALGVNEYIDTHRNRLPFEFALIGYTPRQWSVVDTLLIGLYMYRDLTTSWDDHLRRRDLTTSGDPSKVAYLFPVRAGDEVRPGSNAWVVSGAHTAHGHPQLSDDMHLKYSIPGIWFMVDLNAPGLHVSGVALPGVPGVIVGHNERIAWGVTNLGFNVQDLYREKLDDRTGKYEFQGKMEQARLETELIQVKGRKAVELRQWVTRHGPVIATEGGEHYALRWTAAEASLFSLTFNDIDRARNWREFTQALSGFAGPGQNFVYADVDGNIGYHASGKLPIRRGFTGELPLDGASGQQEWDGYIPFDQLPSSYNPASGILVTANQNPFPADYPYTVSGSFASPYRSTQIWNMLHAKAKLTPEDSLAIEKDVYSGFHERLAGHLVKAWEAKPAADLKDAVDKLRGFNGQMDKDVIAPLIVVLTDHYVRSALAESAAPGKGRFYGDNMGYAVMDHMLRDRPAGWFQSYDQMLLDSLRSGVEEARRQQGTAIDKWRYGRFLKFEVDHPVGKQLPLVASYFDIGPLPLSGGSTTVKQTARQTEGFLGPSERFNAVAGDWDKSLLNVPFGESGHVLSGHYRDQWDAYYNGHSFPMQFEHVDVKTTLTLTPK